VPVRVLSLQDHHTTHLLLEASPKSLSAPGTSQTIVPPVVSVSTAPPTVGGMTILAKRRPLKVSLQLSRWAPHTSVVSPRIRRLSAGARITAAKPRPHLMSPLAPWSRVVTTAVVLSQAAARSNVGVRTTMGKPPRHKASLLTWRLAAHTPADERFLGTWSVGVTAAAIAPKHPAAHSHLSLLVTPTPVACARMGSSPVGVQIAQSSPNHPLDVS
jgi:hypothetical protein